MGIRVQLPAEFKWDTADLVSWRCSSGDFHSVTCGFEGVEGLFFALKWTLRDVGGGIEWTTGHTTDQASHVIDHALLFRVGA